MDQMQDEKIQKDLQELNAKERADMQKERGENIVTTPSYEHSARKSVKPDLSL